jgi:hypothetical protein
MIDIDLFSGGLIADAAIQALGSIQNLAWKPYYKLGAMDVPRSGSQRPG